MAEEDLARLAYESRLYQQQVESLQRQGEVLARALEENRQALGALEGLKGAQGSALFPVGGGVYVKGKTEDAQHVLMEVGAGVVLEKTVEEAKALLGERKKKLEEASVKLQETLQRTVQKLAEIEEKAGVLAEKKA